MTPEQLRACTTRIKQLAALRLPVYDLPADSHIERAVADIAKILLCEDLMKFVDGAAAQGFVINDVDAADLFIKLFPHEYARAIGKPYA